MTLSLTGLGQTDSVGQATVSESLMASQGTASSEASAVKASIAYGSTPSAVVSVSAQTKAAQAKVYAIKHGHDGAGREIGKL